MTFTIDTKEVDNLVNQYPKQNDKAISRAMNKGLSAGATQSLFVAKKEWGGLKVADFKRYTWRTKATSKLQEVQFAVTSRSINLIDFVKKENKKGLSYKLKGRQRQMKGSFKAKGMFFTRDKDKKVTNKQGNKVASLNAHFSITPTSMFKIAKGEDAFVGAFFFGRKSKAFNGFAPEYFRQLDLLLK